MLIEPIGAATVIVGLICLALGYRATVAVLIALTLFGAAAAMFIASANIQPAHLFLPFAILAILTHRREATAAIRSISPPAPGFWLACLVIYGVASAFFLPRIFAGTTDIIPLGTSEYAATGSGVPLGPVSSNLTQSVYMIANLVCFCLVAAVASAPDGFKAVVTGLLLFCVGNAIFALLDLATYATGTQSLLDVIRNARYTLHSEEEVYGLKRIIGSFTEASSFARATLGVLGFTGTLWLCRVRPVLTGMLSLGALVLVLLSTSSAGLAGLLPVLVILYATALMRCGVRPDASRSSAVVLTAPILLVAATLLVLLSSDLSATFRDYVDILILDKADTESGVERASWNTSALQNVIDTWGIGTGLGTVRTSGLAFALVSNVGILGTLFYALFAASALLQLRQRPRTFPSNVRLAARNACLGLLVADLMVGPSVDQGLLFYALAGLAYAQPERSLRRPMRAMPFPRLVGASP